ncbi:DUF434 domain-containing protein [Acidianus sulfidivorans JP7]|uniref:DUF434 domain-containing protein n=1 Tax=Acidianus sulfidivorans TaxID=312539 RepID=UPI001442EFB1|nr:DUF434 domain-containing protein [Acidianus sulfidivorans]AWR97720.2 DUF434 domain-containing protein [Acidianus sulfidivorans JP7]
MISNKKLKEAYIDYKFLLNRGYNRKPALDLVTSRYILNQKERLLLYRCTHSDQEIQNIKLKIFLGSKLIIDGFNVAITILNALDNDEAFICDDGFVRDLGVGKKKEDTRISDILTLFSEFCINLGISDFLIILDSQISHSGEIMKKLSNRKINAKLEKTADKQILINNINDNNVSIISNDFVVLKKAKKVYDMIGLFIKNYVDLPRIPDDL